MTTRSASKFGNGLLPVLAGMSSFVFSLGALVYLTAADEKVVAAVALGVFALLICWIAAERPNSAAARANAALVERLLSVGQGDLTTPAPRAVRVGMPAVAQAVDYLFGQVRASIDAANAIALYDPVTSLPNRVHFHRDVEKLLRAQAADLQSAVIFIDLDRFKAINDTLGHARGDEALVLVATRLSAIASAERREGHASPLVARLAGDEFTMFLPRLRHAADAVRIAGTVLSTLSEPFEIRGHSFDIGASIGVALSPAHGDDLTALMRCSDIAMYQAKTSGRGQVCLFDDGMSREFEARAATEADLRAAIRRNEFELYFQPQVTADTGEVVCVEALLRWHHPRDGLRLPASFIGVAEQCGLIVDVGDWVIDAVGATLAQWRQAGIRTRLALNVSARQLDRSKFFVRLRKAMENAGADLHQLELEFTESATMALDPAVLEQIAALRRDGVRIALDDFGTGFSNLARLKDMPLDRIKIDSSLVSDLDSSEKARVIMQATVQLVHGIGCAAVAEGVESDAQIALLRLVGCDTLQGYVLAEPMEGSALLAWMTGWSPGVGMNAVGAHAVAAPEGSMRTITAA